MQIQQVVASYLAASNIFGYNAESSNEVALEEPEFAYVDSNMNVIVQNKSNGSNDTSSNAAAGALNSGNAVSFAALAGIAALLL